jgi:4-aminobutyrate aminotransferase-like enzyme
LKVDMPVSASLVNHDHSALSRSAHRGLPAPRLWTSARLIEVFLRGEGSWLWDDRGRRHLDFVQGRE